MSEMVLSIDKDPFPFQADVQHWDAEHAHEATKAESCIIKSGFVLTAAGQSVKDTGEGSLNKERAEFEVESFPGERIGVIERFFVEEQSKRCV
jgi:hypothetical protein